MFLAITKEVSKAGVITCHHIDSLVICCVITFLPREAILSAVYAVIVGLSVTLRYCIKMAKHRITQTTPHNSPMTHDAKDYGEI